MTFSAASDATIIAQMRLHFGIITGATEIQKKSAQPGKDKVIPFSELSFLNIMGFIHAFRVAKERGLCSPAELTIGDEILALVMAS